MSGFDHRDEGTPEQAWQLPALPALEVPGRGSRLLVLAAHPDDESLGAGGVICAAAAEGASVTVVVATDGEASHPQSPTHPPHRLAALRRDEVSAAIAELDPDAVVHFLGLPDGALAGHRAALSAQLEYLARSATHVISPWSGDRHPDHEACAVAAAEVAALHDAVHWQYPIWAWHWGDPAGFDWSGTSAIALPDRAREAKRRALSRHVSQIAPLSDAPGDEPVLSAAMLAHFDRAVECFVLGAARDASTPGYFDALYEHSDDPWDLQGRFYERRKRSLLVSSLPQERFRRAFEPGCATGLLTAELAARCDEVVAWDVAGRAVLQATQRLADRPGVHLARGRIPDEWPEGEFDLIVLSEVGYYCVELSALVARVEQSLSPQGVLLACHWRHPAADHPQTAESVHTALGAGLHTLVSHSETDFLLQVWSRTGRSVAAGDGIVP